MRLQALDGTFDAAIVGGGIIGAGIARDAARRGLRVALVEKADFGGGTTAGSTRLIHGGLRYLEMLDFRLVRMDLRERETLLRIAPHLVKPLPFLVPFYGQSAFYRLKLRAGMLLYDALSYDKSLPNHRFLSAAETLEAEPGLLDRGLHGAAMYYDAQVNSPERLAVENIVDAGRHGAVALNYAEAVEAIHAEGRVAGLRVRDTIDGSEREIRAKVVVNASGPWFDRVAPRLGPHPKREIRTTKGVHLACDPLVQNAVVLFSPVDGRLMFAIPWLGCGWIGTTDTDYDGDPAAATATREDISYLKRSAAAFLPAAAKARIHFTTAGVRALVMQPGSESAVSRLHRIDAETPGLISVLGGKITGYRAIAEEATDRICRTLGASRKADTAQAPLPDPAEAVRALESKDPALAERLAPDCEATAADVVYAVREEHCLGVDDFLLRRSLLGFRPDRGLTAAPGVARWMARELGWPEAKEHGELAAYRTQMAGTPA